MSHSSNASEWPRHRRVRNHAECHCLPHSNANYICRICLDWSEERIETDIKCAECPQSYHIKCLPQSQQTPNSWHHCSELDQHNLECLANTDPQRFKWGEIKTIQNLKKEIAKLKKDYAKKANLAHYKPIAFYESFWWNNVLYSHNDFVEVLTDNKLMCVGKIINIFLDKNRAAQLVLEYHWKSEEFEDDALYNKYSKNDCLIFAEISCWYLQTVCIEAINGKVEIVESEKECIKLRQKLETLHQNNVRTKEANNECSNGLRNDWEYIYANVYAMSGDAYHGLSGKMRIGHNANKVKQSKRKRGHSGDGPKRKKRRKSTDYNRNKTVKYSKKKPKMDMSDGSESGSLSESLLRQIRGNTRMRNNEMNTNKKKKKLKPILSIIESSDSDSDSETKKESEGMKEMSSDSSDMPIIRDRFATEECNELSSSSEHSTEFLNFVEMNGNEPSMNRVNAKVISPFGGNGNGLNLEVCNSEKNEEKCGNELENDSGSDSEEGLRNRLNTCQDLTEQLILRGELNDNNNASV